MSSTLEAAADQLYAASPSEFMALRKDLVAQARAAKDRPSATAIGKLRKPSVAAGILNALTRGHPELMERLVSVGEQLRAAQANLHGTALTALRPVRDQLIADVLSAAEDVARAADGALTAAGSDEVRDTVIAALASEEATEAVLAGHLTRALSYSGFGEVDLSDAVARTETGTLLRVIPGRRATPEPAAQPPVEQPEPDVAAPPTPDEPDAEKATASTPDEPDAETATASTVDDQDEIHESVDAEPPVGEEPVPDKDLVPDKEALVDEKTLVDDEEAVPDEQPGDPADAERRVDEAAAAYAAAAEAAVAAKAAVVETSAHVDALKARVTELTTELRAAEAQLEEAFAADAEARQDVTTAVKERQAAAARLAAAESAASDDG